LDAGEPGIDPVAGAVSSMAFRIEVQSAVRHQLNSATVLMTGRLRALPNSG
jgi:hypothetical protein